jgi:hypothetical protein
MTDLDATAALKTAERLDAAGGVASSARLDVTDASQMSAEPILVHRTPPTSGYSPISRRATNDKIICCDR